MRKLTTTCLLMPFLILLSTGVIILPKLIYSYPIFPEDSNVKTYFKHPEMQFLPSILIELMMYGAYKLMNLICGNRKTRLSSLTFGDFFIPAFLQVLEAYAFTVSIAVISPDLGLFFHVLSVPLALVLSRVLIKRTFSWW